MFNLQEGERIDIKARKHWFMLFRNLSGILIIYLLPFIVWRFLENQSGIFVFTTNTSLLFFLSSVWTLFIWAKSFGIWTNYYLDIWIVTNNRIININQIRLFNREVSTLSIEHIQDVTLEINGIIATVLGFGNVYVQTAGESEEFIIKGIANPKQVKIKIVKNIDAKAKSNSLHNL